MSNPTLDSYFKESFEQNIKFIDQEHSVRFDYVDIGTLNNTGAVLIDKQEFSINCSNKELQVQAGYAVTSIFQRFDAQGVMISVARILLSEHEVDRFEEVGRVRVDSGRLELASGNLIEITEELKSKYKVEEEELFQKIEEGQLPDISFVIGNQNDYAIEIALNGAKLIQVNSGYGDGEYPIYFAYSKEVLSAIYIDFLLFERADIIEKLIG